MRAAAITAEPSQVLVYPTGPGEPTRLDRGPLDRITSASWFPDGSRLFVCGAEPARAPRCYTQDLTGPPAPVTPEGVIGSLAPDGRTLLLARTDGTFERSSIDGSEARPAQGLTPLDRQIAWSRDARDGHETLRGVVPLAMPHPVWGSRARPWQLGKAFELLRGVLPGHGPVIFGRAAGRPDERIEVMTIADADPTKADMATCVIIGSAETKAIERPGRPALIYTPRFLNGASR